MYDTGAAIPAAAGTYLLELAAQNVTSLCLGRRGEFVLQAGWYYYIGSAFGTGGLRARLGHHLQPIRKAHWHIDYLLQVLPVQTVTYTLYPSKLECIWCRALAADARLMRAIRDFGSGDTRCGGHLFFSRERLTTAALQGLLGDGAITQPGDPVQGMPLVVLKTAVERTSDA